MAARLGADGLSTLANSSTLLLASSFALPLALLLFLPCLVLCHFRRTRLSLVSLSLYSTSAVCLAFSAALGMASLTGTGNSAAAMASGVFGLLSLFTRKHIDSLAITHKLTASSRLAVDAFFIRAALDDLEARRAWYYAISCLLLLLITASAYVAN